MFTRPFFHVELFSLICKVPFLRDVLVVASPKTQAKSADAYPIKRCEKNELTCGK